MNLISRIKESYRLYLLKSLINVKSDTIIIGPWMGEVGPEIQYWIPFLNNLKDNNFFYGKRLIIVSRGNASCWYSKISDEYVDIFNFVSLEEYKNMRLSGSTQKQLDFSETDNYLINIISSYLNISNFSLIHPSSMWKLISPYLHSAKNTSWVLNYLKFSSFSDFSFDDTLFPILPEKYIFLKFYKSELFNPELVDQNRIINLLKSLSDKFVFVTVDQLSNFDDHEFLKLDFDVIHIPMDTPNNLLLQSYLIKNSSGFIGTYGGFSLLPAYYNKPSLAFYTSNLKGTSYQDMFFKHEAITVYVTELFDTRYNVTKINNFYDQNFF